MQLHAKYVELMVTLPDRDTVQQFIDGEGSGTDLFLLGLRDITISSKSSKNKVHKYQCTFGVIKDDTICRFKDYPIEGFRIRGILDADWIQSLRVVHWINVKQFLD